MNRIALSAALALYVSPAWAAERPSLWQHYRGLVVAVLVALAVLVTLVGSLVLHRARWLRTEAALRASEERYREVVESQTDLICRYRPDTTLTFVNEAYCRHFGRPREALIGRSFLELMPEESREAARQHVRSLAESPRVEPYDHPVVGADGSVGWQEWVDHAVRASDGRVVEFQAIGRDIGDRKRAEEAIGNLTYAARLSMVGELTGAIAHEINQPLSAILSNTDAAEMILESGDGGRDEVLPILADIRREDLRASEVVRHVRSLLLRRPMEAAPVDLNQVTADVLRIIRPDAQRRRVSLHTELGTALPPVSGDHVQLQQLLLNLVLNGMEAMARMPEANRRLTVRTGIDGAGTVELSVSDTGHGIAADLLPRLFDSFVTTREQGMGLGLSISRSIVEAHDGTIGAENNREGGATFHVTLPVA